MKVKVAKHKSFADESVPTVKQKGVEKEIVYSWHSSFSLLFIIHYYDLFLLYRCGCNDLKILISKTTLVNKYVIRYEECMLIAQPS